MPSYSEILKLTGLKSKNSAFGLVKAMVEDNLVVKDAFGKLAPGHRLTQLPLLGIVEAGFPTYAEESIADTLSLDDFLVKNKEATFILKVSGDSMIEAGIMPGDLVLVERGKPVKQGDIVIAEVDTQWTLKYFRRANGKPYLQAANKKYPDFYPREELKIAAVVVGSIRKY